ncbi:MAG: DUF2339 domain-containing protein [Planctomycetes bacterium]|nr:DUF2339 domain-containing protein [Planctomycetota bacterium]
MVGALVAVGGGVTLLIGAIQGIMALSRVRGLTDDVAALRKEVARLRSELAKQWEAERRRTAATTAADAERPPQHAATHSPSVVVQVAEADAPAAPAPPTPSADRAPPATESDAPQPAIPEPIPVPSPAAPDSRPAPAQDPAARSVPLPEDTVPLSSPLRQHPERPPHPGRSLPSAGSADAVEQMIGKRLITWVGVATVFLSLAFFVKYAYDQHWLGQVFGPRMRIGTVAGAGFAMIVAGLRLRSRDMSALGLGLVGGGQAVLYLAVYAGANPSLGWIGSALFGPTIAFALMTAVTAFGLALAVRLDAMVIAILAVLGGFATPVLVSTGTNARDALFIYLMILDTGVLLTALFRRWRALDTLTFVGTAALFAGWFAHYHHTYPVQPDWPTLGWLSAFFLVFLALPFVGHWRERTAVTVERFGLAVGNLAWFLGYSCYVLADRHPHTLAWLCLVLAGLYLAIGVAVRRRVATDVRMTHAFVTIATMLVTLSLFFHLRVDGLTIAWFAEAVVLVQLGYLFSYPPSRWLALAVAALALGRLARDHWHLPYAAAQPILNTDFLMLMTAPLAFALIAVVHRVHRSVATEADRLAGWLCGCGGGILALLAIRAEMAGWLGTRLSGDALDRAEGLLVSGLCSSAALGYLGMGWLRDDRRTAIVGLALWMVAAGAALLLYAHHWPDHILVTNTRFAALAAAVTTLAVYAATAWRHRARFGPPEGFGDLIVTALPIAILVACGVESVTWCQTLVDADRLSAWSIGAIGVCGGALILLSGIRRRYDPCLVVGGIALLGGATAALVCYAWTWPSAWMFANQRCALGVATVVLMLLVRRGFRPLDHLLGQPGRTALLAIPAVLVWLLVTLEPSTWLTTNLVDQTTASRAATFSITLAWLVYAAALLAAGFRWQIRWVRFTALGLFGITALKLLLIDMAHAQQLFRILSFLATGLTLIAASYAYHRAEKRMGTSRLLKNSLLGVEGGILPPGQKVEVEETPAQ